MTISSLGTNPLALLGLGTGSLGTSAAAAGTSALTAASATSPRLADELVSLSLGSDLLGATAAPGDIGSFLSTLQQQATTAAGADVTEQLGLDASLLDPSLPALTAGAQLSASTAAAGTAAAAADPFSATALGSLTASGQELAALFAGGSPPTSGALYDVLA